MRRFINAKSIATALVALALLAAVFGGFALRSSTKQSHAAAPKKTVSRNAGDNNNPFCSKIGKKYQASAGAQIACFGPKPSGHPASQSKTQKPFSPNVDAADPQEDIAPNGTQAYGQSEESVAAIGRYVVESWNDATGFFAPPCSPMFKDQLTGLGFSSNGGASFTDLGGLPNSNCATTVYQGDPSVETWQHGGTAYFYISSLYYDSSNNAEKIAMDACAASGSTLNCNPNPIIIGNPGPNGFLDKDFLSIDPKRGLLYASYTDFTSGDNIDLSVCDIGNGALGGTPLTPVCVGDNAAPAAVVVASSSGCNELEGAYPAVDLATGNVYVAYENNWASNLFGCQLPVQENVNQVPFPCVAIAAGIPTTGTCTFTTNTFPVAIVSIVSMDGAFIPGYSRFPMNDFPRIAVSDKFGTVSIVWNDARFHPYGDILLQSFSLANFPNTIQSNPTRINSSTSGWHMLPALRNVDDDGDLQISFYQRASANTALTDVYTTIDTSPTTTSTPSNVKVTTGSSDWLNVSSDINPNFGDYTDNYVIATPSAPYTQQTLYVAWADGRLGDPQPFNAHAHTS